MIVEKLASIEDQLKTMESNQKYHLEAALTMTEMGRDFQNLTKSIGPLEKKIGDAANRNISIYNLLLDHVGFQLSIMPDFATQLLFGFGALDENSMKQLFETSDLTYMPAGPQVITAE